MKVIEEGDCKIYIRKSAKQKPDDKGMGKMQIV